MGMAGPTEHGRILSPRWDKRDDFDGPTDCDWVGEDAAGVWSTVHPLAILALDPLIWGAIIDWQYGQHDITPADMTDKSNFEYECKLVLKSATNREEARRMKSTGPSSG